LLLFTTIIQLFKGSWGFSGNFIDENLSDPLRAKIEEILAKHKYYTELSDGLPPSTIQMGTESRNPKKQIWEPIS
jgi:hypothetical protein